MPQEETRVYCRRKKKRALAVDGGHGMDSLPDETLQHILSFLPSREAVQTCVLAWRWRHLWRSVPALRIATQSKSYMLTEQEFSNLERFMNNLLLLRNHSVPLDLCDFNMKWIDYSDDRPQFSSWIQQSLLDKCQILRLICSNDNDDTLMLCNRPLISQHLTTLEFWSVALRRKTLDFSSCMALKSVLLRGCSIDARKILSPSLERLAMLYCSFEYRNSRTCISTPRLGSAGTN